MKKKEQIFLGGGFARVFGVQKNHLAGFYVGNIRVDYSILENHEVISYSHLSFIDFVNNWFFNWELDNNKIQYECFQKSSIKFKPAIIIHPADVVEMPGHMPQQQIAGLLRASHLFVSVSSSDGNNISLNEAMACGCFSVVSDIPANRQWIEDGKNGFFTKAITAEAIAAKILQAYASYNDLIVEANVINQKVINEKAIWKTNMQKVEQQYLKLCRHE